MVNGQRVNVQHFIQGGEQWHSVHLQRDTSVTSIKARINQKHEQHLAELKILILNIQNKGVLLGAAVV